MAGKGGKREGAGRKPGIPNKATATVKELARQYGPEVIEGFIDVFRNPESHAAKIAAGKELLDRAYGKATQIVGGDEDAPLRVINEIILRGVRPDSRD